MYWYVHRNKKRGELLAPSIGIVNKDLELTESMTVVRPRAGPGSGDPGRIVQISAFLNSKDGLLKCVRLKVLSFQICPFGKVTMVLSY